MLPLIHVGTGLIAQHAWEWVVGHQPGPLSVLGPILTVVDSNHALVLTARAEPFPLCTCDSLKRFLSFAAIHELDKNAEWVILDVLLKPV